MLGLFLGRLILNYINKVSLRAAPWHCCPRADTPF